jgi:hypothetical protein
VGVADLTKHDLDKISPFLFAVSAADGGSGRGRVFSPFVGAIQGDRGGITVENGIKRDIERGVDPEGKRSEEVFTPGGKEPIQYARECTPCQPFGTNLRGETWIPDNT